MYRYRKNFLLSFSLLNHILFIIREELCLTCLYISDG